MKSPSAISRITYINTCHPKEITKAAHVRPAPRLPHAPSPHDGAPKRRFRDERIFFTAPKRKRPESSLRVTTIAYSRGEDAYPRYIARACSGVPRWLLYSRRPERPRRGMVADGGPDRPSGWAAGRVTHFLTQTLACMHECIQGALRPLLGH